MTLVKVITSKTQSPDHSAPSSGYRGAASRLVREPLIHFFVFAAVFLGVYHLLGRENKNAPDTIVITAERITQLGLMFQKARQRSPSEAEMKELIDDFVREEIYYREAMKLGLDTDDTMIRRRLRQKMEFLGDAAADLLQPSEAELRSFFETNQNKFAEEPRFSFEQIFLSPSRRGKRLDADAAAVLAQLSVNPAANTSAMGDPTTLPAYLPEAGRSALVSTFGKSFVEGVETLELGQWSGPVTSDYGLHLVRLTKIVTGGSPDFSAVREAVKNEWTYRKREELESLRFEEFLKSYDVRIESGRPKIMP